MNVQVYRDDIIGAYVRTYAGEIGDAILLQNDNARPHSSRIVHDHLLQETIMCMGRPARFQDLNPNEHVWDTLERRLDALNPPTHTLATLSTALQKQGLSLLMEQIHLIIKSITHRCMYCIASRGDHIPY